MTDLPDSGITDPIELLALAYKLNKDLEAESQLLVVRRDNIFTTAMYFIGQPDFNFNARFAVEFSGEDVVDIGGAKREFFRYD
uniref:HECT domain-containing protein n=1 Tax=Strigamia maritima TaxID=126957 RepID=T1II01_STRMM